MNCPSLDKLTSTLPAPGMDSAAVRLRRRER
nr:MAG TPA: hypothetical protein [Caudoviricetes sp.]